MKSLNYKLFFDEAEDYGDDDRKYWDTGLGAAGCIFIAKDTGQILLAHRSKRVDHPHTWSTWGGKIDEGESVKDAIVREVEEETGYDGKYKINFLWTFEDPSEDFQYHNYLVVVPSEFTPKLNWENDNSKWVEWGEWPTPLHHGMKKLIEHAGPKLKRIISLIKKKQSDIFEVVDIPPAIVQSVANNATTNYNIVVTTLFGESRGEGERGMQAVMNVIMNRTRGNFNQAKDIILARKQFSMWNNITDPNVVAKFASRKYKDDELWKTATRIADQAAGGHLPDITGGATSYFNPKKSEKTWVPTEIKKNGKNIGGKIMAPEWAGRMNCTVIIKNHVFLKPIIKQKKKKKTETKIPMCLKEMIETGNGNGAMISKIGLVDDGVWAYEMHSPYSYLRYRYEPGTKMFYLDNIGTPAQENKNKGYAKTLLETFFQLIMKYGGMLDSGPYTSSGMAYIKPAVERFAVKYGVRLVKGRDPYA